jgi:hypothetical protein
LALSPFSAILVTALLVSCATLSSSKENAITAVHEADGTFAAAGQVIEVTPVRITPASIAGMTLRGAHPLYLGAYIDMDLLNRTGYANWRRDRLRSMNDIQELRIAFYARLPEGGVERQSGMLYLPAARSDPPRELTWMIYLKGTELIRDRTQSRGKGIEVPMMRLAASLGYAVWSPDYSGMGDSQGVQEFCVPKSLADSALDGLNAARSWLDTERLISDTTSRYRESGKLVVIGYSEGGLACMGTITAIADHRIEIPGLSLEAAYSMGAPLHLSIWVSSLDSSPITITHPEYQISLVLGWARSFPDQMKIEDVLLPRTISRILPLFDSKTSKEKLCKRIASTLGRKEGEVTDFDLFTPEYCDALRSDPESISYYRLQEEARLDHWTPPPGVHIVLAASPNDEIVPFENSLSEYKWTRTHAPEADISLVRLGSSNHERSGLEALLYAFLDHDKEETRSHG